MKNKKVLLFDWRFGWGLFFLILAIGFLISGLVMLITANFTDRFQYLGNGFWSLKNFNIKLLLFNWEELDNKYASIPWQSHNFFQVNIALIFLIFLVPCLLVIGCFLVIRWWWKTRI